MNHTAKFAGTILRLFLMCCVSAPLLCRYGIRFRLNLLRDNFFDSQLEEWLTANFQNCGGEKVGDVERDMTFRLIFWELWNNSCRLGGNLHLRGGSN